MLNLALMPVHLLVLIGVLLFVLAACGILIAGAILDNTFPLVRKPFHGDMRQPNPPQQRNHGP